MDLKNNLFPFLFFLASVIGFSQTGPGGVGTNDGSSELIMWYRTDNAVTTSGSNVTNWGNSAGYSAHDMTTSGSANPQLISGTLNGYDEIQFNASGILQTGLSLTTSNFVTNQATSYIYAKANSITSSWPYATLPHQSQRFSCHIPWSNGNVYFDIGECCNTSARIQVSGLSGLTGYSLWSYDANPASGKQLYRNGTLLQNNANSSTYSSHASHRFGLGDNFNGNMTEVIIFKTKVNTAQRLIIDNYLAAKYGQTLAANDLYTQDNSGNGNFDHDVAGIGQATDGSNHIDSQGTGIIRISGATDLVNNEFLIWGHDNGVLLLNNTTDVQSDQSYARLGRVWRVSESDISSLSVDVGAIDISVDMTAVTGYSSAFPPQLLVDTDNDGFFNDENPLTTAVSLGGNVYRFNGVTLLSDGTRFTFAIGRRTVITNRRITYKVNKN